LVAIEKNHIQPAISKNDAQGETHMPAAPDDDNLFQFPHELPIASFG
jgi:hypothetical protein